MEHEEFFRLLDVQFGGGKEAPGDLGFVRDFMRFEADFGDGRSATRLNDYLLTVDRRWNRLAVQNALKTEEERAALETLVVEALILNLQATNLGHFYKEMKACQSVPKRKIVTVEAYDAKLRELFLEMHGSVEVASAGGWVFQPKRDRATEEPGKNKKPRRESSQPVVGGRAGWGRDGRPRG
jgi:hypothetical protein